MAGALLCIDTRRSQTKYAALLFRSCQSVAMYSIGTEKSLKNGRCLLVWRSEYESPCEHFLATLGLCKVKSAGPKRGR